MMNIGIFVRSLSPASPAEARFQESILEGLRHLNSQRYRYYVFSPDIPKGLRDTPELKYVALARHGRASKLGRTWTLKAGGVLRFALRLIGAKGSRCYGWLTRKLHYEPPYYRQLRELDIRLLWNLSEHAMQSFVPFIKVIWDINHRIHPWYPEYSYSRYGFDGGERSVELLHKASYVIVGTEEGKRQLVDAYGAHSDRIRVIPFPTPILPVVQPFRVAESKFERRKPYVYYPARFWPHKNHVAIIEALRILRDTYGLSLNCVFSGAEEGNLGYVLRYAEKLGVRDQVEYVGVVPVDELVCLYRHAAALTYCSAVGPDNLPPLEAMSLECPVITADVPGAREQYGDAALYFIPTDEHQLASHIKALLDDKSLREELIARGTARAAKWTAADYAKSVGSIFDEFALIARAWERCDSTFT